MNRRRLGLILAGCLLFLLAYPIAYIGCRAAGLLTRYEFQLTLGDSPGPTEYRVIGSEKWWTRPFDLNGPAPQTGWIDRLFAPCVQWELTLREIRERSGQTREVREER